MSMQINRFAKWVAILGSSLVSALVPLLASAHCDSLDGPVVRDARAALENGDADLVLRWVTEEHEAAIRGAFAKTLTVRAQSGEARELADRYFFETLVRLHRAGEGEPFTGLKPAGGIGSGIAAADQALDSGDGAALARRLAAAIEHGIEERFTAASELKRHASESVADGREYVEAYVDYVHFVEAVDELAAHGASHAHRE
jgi:Family of unknown function (DUF6448)